MSRFSLHPFCNEHRAAWDGVVRASKNGNFLHLRDYMGYHAHRFDERSVLVEKKGKFVAVFPCNWVDEKVISHGGLTYAGLIYGSELRAVDVIDIFSLLAAYFKKQGATKLLYKAIPHIFHSYPAEEDLYALFRLGARLVRRDLSSAIKMNARLKLSDSRKNTIRKAVKEGAEIREGDFLDAFHTLLTGALAKFGAQPVHSLEELQLLKSRFQDVIRLFGAFKEERLLAAGLVFDFGHVVHTQYLASSDEGRGVGALDYVLAHLLEVFADREYFSFGISTEQDGQYMNEGLIFQKEGFGGRAIIHDHYELEL